jgi:hypothetical protein
MSGRRSMGGESTSGNPSPGTTSKLQIEQDDLVIFGEDGKFYLVPKATYTATRLPAALMSAPEFIVGLGSLVSDITAFQSDVASQLTAKCACLVLNLAAIRQLSEKLGEPHAFDTDGDGGIATSSTPMQEHVPEPRLDPEDLVIFGEDGTFYFVTEETYKTQELPPDLKSAPELMVKLGTVVADIPSLPTAGSACFLLNLASVRKGSEEAARLIKSHRREREREEQPSAPGGPTA